MRTRLLSSLMVLTLLLGGVASAQTKPLSLTEGKKLKNLKQYKLKDFHLKKKSGILISGSTTRPRVIPT